MTPTATAPQRSTRASVFTVATALAWLGHDCDGLCPAAAICSPADLWFVPHPSPRHPTRHRSLIVVDVGDDPARAADIRALLREVNRCIGRSHIHVRERVPADQQHALMTRLDMLSRPAAGLYLRHNVLPSTSVRGSGNAAEARTVS